MKDFRVNASQYKAPCTRVLVTGVTGFIGRAFLERLLVDYAFGDVHAVVRRWPALLPDSVHTHEISDLRGQTDLKAVLKRVDVVIHMAARAHVLRDEAVNPLAEFRQVNVDSTVSLARQSAEAGVKRFVFLSSIGVNGNETLGEPFTECSSPKPGADYAISKYEAELALRQVLQDTDTEFVIIRPPLVYGPDAPGNFGRLLRLIARGLPLPLGCVSNLRSLVARENLVDFIVTCINHPKAAGEVFLVSDGQDLSTTELLQHLAEGMGKRLILLPVPLGLLRLVANVLGQKNAYQQLCGSLQIDSSKARTLLDWTPPVRVDDALRKTAEHFLVDQS